MTSLDRLRTTDSFENESFEGLDMQRFDFAGKEFWRCTFRNSKLQESRWARARLEECAFEDCDLTQMLPADMRAHEVRFKGCKLMGVQWTAASLDPRLSFEGCSLRYASFADMNLRDTAFIRCEAMEASFVDVNLTDADFSETDLTGTNFQNSDLTRANFSTARGAFIDPARNRVKGARVSIESAVLLAASFGMKVSAFHEGHAPASPRKPARRAR